MGLLLDPYKHHGLTEYMSISLEKYAETFILSKFFTNKEPHETNKIIYERRSSARKLAEFVSMNEDNPLPIKHSMKVANLEFELARTFEMKTFTKNMLDKMAGINMSFASKKDRDKYADEIIAYELNDLRDRIANRKEQLACLGVVNGKIQITDSEQDIEYDFGFVADKQIVTLAAKWSDPASDPIADLRRCKNLMMDNGDLKPDTVVLGRNAAEAFLRHPKVITALDTLNYRVGSIDINQANTDNSTAELIAQMLGMKFYEYSQKFTNSQGIKEDFFPTNSCVLIAPSEGFIEHAGTIYRMDENTNLMRPMAREVYVYPTINEHKTKLSWTSESICIPMIHEPEAVISLRNVV